MDYGSFSVRLFFHRRGCFLKLRQNLRRVPPKALGISIRLSFTGNPVEHDIPARELMKITLHDHEFLDAVNFELA